MQSLCTVSTNYHYQFEVLRVDSLGVFGITHYPPLLKEHILMHWLSFWFGSVKGTMSLLHNQCGYLYRWVGAFCIREADYFVLHTDMGVTYPFHLPHSVGPCLPWPSSVSDSIPLWVHYLPVSMGIDVVPSALHMCSFQGLQPNHFTCGLHPSLVDAPVDIYGTGESCLSWIFWEHENLSSLSIIWLIQLL